MHYIGVYKYTKTDESDLEIARHCIRFLYDYHILRKIGISCEVSKCLFFRLFINASFTFLSSV
ncbi:hypothetical protein COD09_21060 [Bacillus cereus]|uniref:Uncharacterized protein n=1 Tax=Bacillus cereus TaxID=1396 RepID=A0A2C1DAF1_BACCE|nr:hypothetical protein COD09_21060 [Bacillus cereus]